MISGIFHDYYCGIFGYCSKHYLFFKYLLRVDCPIKAQLLNIPDKSQNQKKHNYILMRFKQLSIEKQNNEKKFRC